MGEQENLFAPRKLTRIENISKMPTDQAFAEFHRRNPWVVEELEKIAWEMLKHGHRKLGVQQLIEIFRWETRRQTISHNFKINNNFASRYARMMLDRNPHWGQVFELRRLRS